jgi:hypothetical protein
VCHWDDCGRLTVNHEQDQDQYHLRSYASLGLYGDYGDHISMNHFSALATLNDIGKTWPEIALIILKDINGYLKEKK